MPAKQNGVEVIASRRQLRAEFKETARSIISDDRVARRRGRSQNTIGAIETALVRAYEIGRKSATQSKEDLPTTTDLITWIEVPPRARNTLINMSHCFDVRFGRPDKGPSKIERFDVGGRSRWRIIDELAVSDHSVADGSVRPLIKLGLLAPSLTEPNVYELTLQGVALCKEYWKRRAEGDSSLPLEAI